jgi:hypothetical protein
MVLIAGAGVWYAGSRGDPVVQPSRKPSTSASVGSNGVSPGRSTGAAGPCVIAEIVPGARCPSEPECFGSLAEQGGVARVDRRGCDQVHTWETFALGSLSPQTRGVGRDVVKRDASVQALCRQFHLATLTDDLFSWEVEVLPPTPEEFNRGERTFRCLGGKGPDKLTGPTLPVG